jgi:hypothetical protein
VSRERRTVAMEGKNLYKGDVMSKVRRNGGNGGKIPLERQGKEKWWQLMKIETSEKVFAFRFDGTGGNCKFFIIYYLFFLFYALLRKDKMFQYHTSQVFKILILKILRAFSQFSQNEAFVWQKR